MANDVCEDESKLTTSTARASTERARTPADTIINRFEDTRFVSFAEITVGVAGKLPLEILQVEHSYSRAVTLRFLHIVQSLDSTRIVSLSEVSLKKFLAHRLPNALTDRCARQAKAAAFTLICGKPSELAVNFGVMQRPTRNLVARHS